MEKRIPKDSTLWYSLMLSDNVLCVRGQNPISLSLCLTFPQTSSVTDLTREHPKQYVALTPTALQMIGHHYRRGRLLVISWCILFVADCCSLLPISVIYNGILCYKRKWTSVNNPYNPCIDQWAVLINMSLGSLGGNLLLSQQPSFYSTTTSYPSLSPTAHQS